jgi:hypothetical protein
MTDFLHILGRAVLHAGSSAITTAVFLCFTKWHNKNNRDCGKNMVRDR